MQKRVIRMHYLLDDFSSIAKIQARNMLLPESNGTNCSETESLGYSGVKEDIR